MQNSDDSDPVSGLMRCNPFVPPVPSSPRRSKQRLGHPAGHNQIDDYLKYQQQDSGEAAEFMWGRTYQYNDYSGNTRIDYDEHPIFAQLKSSNYEDSEGSDGYYPEGGQKTDHRQMPFCEMRECIELMKKRCPN